MKMDFWIHKNESIRLICEGMTYRKKAEVTGQGSKGSKDCERGG